MNDAETPKPMPGQTAAPPSERHDLWVVGIGASAGGIKALKQFFSSMPRDSGMAFVVILHLSPQHESTLDLLLRGQTPMPVTQVQATVKVEPNHVYVIPPNKNLAMVDGHIELTEPEPTPGKRVAIDMFLRTLADAYGKNAVGVILSGTGADGTIGLKRVKEQGGIAIVQQPEDAEYDSMPRSAIASALVDLILPAEGIPEKIIWLRDNAERLPLPADKDAPPPEIGDAESLREVLTLLRVRTRHDFHDYRLPTLLRRVARRLQVHELPDTSSYLGFLRDHPEELNILLKNLLISVTNFFRDSEAFSALEREGIPGLFAGKTADDVVRVWVAGCATGEEAYSLAILLNEYADKLREPPKLQIFATDIDEEALAEARAGRYPEAIAGDVTPERLNRFFVKEGDYYRVKKTLRNVVLFAPHNVLRDPPFFKLDLISCRNLLIYLNRETQERVLQIFHFVLRPGGLLFLGNSESAETAAYRFAPVNKKQRLYAGRGPQAPPPPPVMPHPGNWQVNSSAPSTGYREKQLSFSELHYKLLELEMPPSILVNGDDEIVHLSENAGRFLHIPGGEPSRELLKAVHPSLRHDLRAALFISKQENGNAQAESVQFNPSGGEESFVNIRVRQVETPDSAGGFRLVIFDESGKPTAADAAGTPVVTASAAGEQMETIVRRLEDELARSKDRLRSTIEQHEAAAEELKASNEELQAVNEEMRSTTEELETGKEELQSLNEELNTVNKELEEKVDEVSHANADLQNLMASTEIGSIFLDRELRIKGYTPQAQQIFNIIASDIGRPLKHLTHKLAYDGLADDAGEVLKHSSRLEREISGTDDRHFVARLSPYRTLEDKIDGVVLTFVEVTELKRTAEALRHREAVLQVTQKTAKAGVWNFRLPGGGGWMSKESYRLYEADPMPEISLENWLTKLHPNDREAVAEALRQAVEGHGEYSHELALNRPGEGVRWLWEVGRADYDVNGNPQVISGITLDITERKQAEEALREAARNKDEFLAMLAHELRNPLAPIRSGLEVLRRTNNQGGSNEQALDVIGRQIEQVVRLVDDLLDISRITQRKISLRKERIELATVIETAVESCQPLLEVAGHELTIRLPPEPVYLDGDLTRLSQVILNLLNNAVKYTRPGGRITLTAVRENDKAEIRVRDTGIGIAPDMLPRIFDMFTQVGRDSERKQGGLGIGLSLVKQLIELHGGTVEARSAGLGMGSEFVVCLPSAAAVTSPETKPGGGTESSSKPQPRRILIVDDNIDAADLLEVILRMDGHEVRSAADGQTAIQIASEFQPEVCLLDIGLPDLDGYEVARQIRSQIPTALIIAISGWGRVEDRRRSQAAGFNHHFVKPVKVRDLQKLIAE